MTHNMKLKPEPYELIKRGIKTIELRLLDEKRRQIKVGDTIIFKSTETGEALTSEVVDLHIFPSFDELYRTLPLTACGYTEDNIHTASPEDMSIYYSHEEQSKSGVVGIEIRLSV